MPTDTHSSTIRRARTFPVRQVLPPLLRSPLQALEDLSRAANGEITRLSLGVFRPYLVTHPDHLQYILRDNAENYRREGLMWKPLSRLVGEPSGADPVWPVKRDVFMHLMSGPNIASYTNEMAKAITDAVEDLGRRVKPGEPVDAMTEITRIVYRAILQLFVGDRLTRDDVERLGNAILTATTSSFRARMLLPFVPHSIPLPGDRAFHRAVREVDEIVYPLVHQARREGAGDGILSLLLQAKGPDGEGLSDKDIRDGVVSIFVAGTETTVTALTWLWVVLAEHPQVMERMREEIEQVVGLDVPQREHLPRLSYTKMVTQELLRMYPIGWIIPRVVAEDDVIDGVRMKRGATVIVSPYLTHRLPQVWPNPHVFDPERFAPGQRRHRFAYLAFGAGPHKCVGTQFFTVEAQIILSAMIPRLRPALYGPPTARLQAGLTLKPDKPIQLTLQPVVS
ncbi:cytochrome P450 [Thermomonospora catenispora]|uniref:cytochrome P450 n=1 Tax=Thermomonospora catenispora TaxID=2493090 RepID=UPI00111F238D|nr:cytochrome P450 [Thermomonospora catenispora]TNY38393.1 cytochrome P450 [Thermomonospora catenispora]